MTFTCNIENGVCTECHRPLAAGRGPNRICKASGYDPAKHSCGSRAPAGLVDYKLNAGEKHEVRVFRARCIHLGERLPDDRMAKTKCGKGIFTPVYRCELFRLCTPFDKNVDTEFLHPCYNCSNYQGATDGQSTASPRE